MDCCENDEAPIKYVEMKTSRELYTPNNERNFKRHELVNNNHYYISMQCVRLLS